MTEYVRATIVNEGGQHRLVTTPISMTETLTLRDQFAMAALTSMLAPVQDIRDTTPTRAAELSYRFADAMLEARKEKK
jgi:hypothetical protein